MPLGAKALELGATDGLAPHPSIYELVPSMASMSTIAWQSTHKIDLYGPLERGRRDRCRLLDVDRHAADPVVLEHTARVAEVEGGDQLALFRCDHDALLLGGVGGGGGEQSGDQQALQKFGGSHFEFLWRGSSFGFM